MAAEVRWLRRWGWLFPALGLPLGLLAFGGRWVFMTLDPVHWPDSARAWITAPGLALGLVIALLPLLWRMGLYVENRWGGVIRRAGLAPLGAVGVFVCAEAALRSPAGQETLWQSVRARSGADFFAREVSLFRLDSVAQQRAAGLAPGIVVAGSSQMLHAMDPVRLAERTRRPVYRRAVAGMFPVELCAASGYLDLHQENTLLLMVSGFDLGGRDRLYLDAIRPLATPAGVDLLIRAADWRFLFHQWRGFIDLSFAARCEAWRARDYVRYLLQHPFAAYAPSARASAGAEPAAQRDAYVRLGQNERMLAFSEAALDAFIGGMAGRVKSIVVFEGQVSPRYPGNEIHELSARARRRMESLAAAGRVVYIPLEKQELALSGADWLDMAHVNEAGRMAYTEAFARALQRLDEGNTP